MVATRVGIRVVIRADIRVGIRVVIRVRIGVDIRVGIGVSIGMSSRVGTGSGHSGFPGGHWVLFAIFSFYHVNHIF